jgi:hypothetical protein
MGQIIAEYFVKARLWISDNAKGDRQIVTTYYVETCHFEKYGAYHMNMHEPGSKTKS